jgi:predicted phage terminase large subunit-like protein
MTELSSAHTAAIAELANEELARRSLIDFGRRTIPEFQSPRHLQHIANLLEAVERGDLRRLLITVHPGSGKSVLLQAFATWYLGRNPRRRIIAASAGAELAERNSRASRSLFTESAWPFPVALSKATTAQNRWETTEGGGLFAVGVGGGITGWRANLLLLDDLQNDSLSVGERESLWQWFREILMPRLEPNGAVVLVQQRWGEDDIPGRIMESAEAPDWRVVRLAALAEPGDLLGRPVGESLWPQRWPVSELERQKIAMGSRAFECAFQGNPIPAEGNLIRAEWLQRYNEPPTEFAKIVCALDAAAKVGVANDYSALVKIGVAKGAFYVLDVWRAKVEFPALIRRVAALGDETPKPSAIYVEDASNATALIQALKRDAHLPIVPVAAKGSKMSRVEGITGTLEAKKVFLPKEAPWLLDFERELLSFPSGKHDDMVDALTLALSRLTGRNLPANWWFEFGGYGENRYYFGDDDKSVETEERIVYGGNVTSAIQMLGSKTAPPDGAKGGTPR